MESEIQHNKQGQALGRKGQETRARLMEAARRLLRSQSPVELTTVAVAAEAGTSPASFYMYFDDTKDILFALSEVAGQDMEKIHAIFDQPWEIDHAEKHAIDVIDALNEVWNKHRAVLRYRNLEATRGDRRFEELRMNTFIPFIERFAERILSINPAQGTRKRADAFAEASILHGAMEHMAATDPEVMERGLGAKRINDNMARIVALILRGGLPPTVLGEPGHKTNMQGEKKTAGRKPVSAKPAAAPVAAPAEKKPAAKRTAAKKPKPVPLG
ncbi:TetR/AcrR family transcriptional regulator [Herbaspirillum autotrophicum]|uniref:TetR/AcrR family transcriptional regulator n=1 Tax=Herbaspirillum autotrophicum TaxID=180195 RepID=UPI00067B286C|nr:TetR/AcrR family transcriptional regulator [Herbaspirillum autotrophicum]